MARTNFEKIKDMTVEELAEFLDDRCAETPPDFCDNCELIEKDEGCNNCPYLDEKAAWENWLRREE